MARCFLPLLETVQPSSSLTVMVTGGCWEGSVEPACTQTCIIIALHNCFNLFTQCWMIEIHEIVDLYLFAATLSECSDTQAST